MRFSDSETQKLIRNTARSYLADKFPWERLYAIERGEAQIGDDDIRDMAAMGWLGLLAPERDGGGGVSLLEAAIVTDEMGYAAVPAPVTVSNVAADVISRASQHEEVRSHLGELAAGKRFYTVSEAGRRWPGVGRAGALSAVGGVLRGSLAAVPFGSYADFCLAPMSIDGEPAIGLVPLDGARRQPVQMIDRPGYCDVRFEDTPVRECTILATGQAADELRERCDVLSTALGLIELGGMMQRVLEITAEYISNRVQFGQPIAKFQAARHRAAELLMQTETTRWAAYYALWQLERDPAADGDIWLAKHWAIRAAERVFQVSHLLVGGVGVGTEYPLHLFTQGIAAFAVRGGTMSEMVGRTLETLRGDRPTSIRR